MAVAPTAATPSTRAQLKITRNLQKTRRLHVVHFSASVKGRGRFCIRGNRELLSDPATQMDRQQAKALMIDLSRASTLTEGGFCTFQPVVHGGACPWDLNCRSCD